MAILLAVLFILPTTVGAKPTPIEQCRHDLAWQRWNYTKDHVNVIQSIRQQYNNKLHNRWASPRNLDGCRHMAERARSLRLAEHAHWKRLRLQPAGVKWIIRRTFIRAGHDSVLLAWKIVSCESNFNVNEYNGADLGIWQIELSAHPEITWRIATSPELSTAWAWRASDHGRNFSPTWVCATYYGIP